MPGIDLDALAAEITIRRVWNLLGYDPSPRIVHPAIRWLGLPGTCSSSAPSLSFSVNLTLGRYHGLQCNSTGDSLELWAAVHWMSPFPAAIDPCSAIGREVAWIARW
jgi:hypothetical protein